MKRRKRRKKRMNWVGIVSVFVGGAAGIYIGISLLWFLTNEDPTNLISQIKQEGVQDARQGIASSASTPTEKKPTANQTKSKSTPVNAPSGRPAERKKEQTDKQNDSMATVGSENSQPSDKPTDDELSQATPDRPEPARINLSKAEVPTQEAQEWARESASEIFQERYKNARTSLAKLAIAKEIMALADETEDDNATKYVLYDIALDIAINEQDLDRVEAITVKLLAHFRIDEAELRSKTWGELVQAKEFSEREQTLLFKEILSRSAIQLKFANPSSAVILTNIALNHFPFPIPNDTNAELRLLNQTAKLTHEKLKTFTADPSNEISAESLLESGTVQCFILNQWELGLSKLAKGSDTLLANMASDEIDVDNADPKSIHQVAEAWQKYANTIADDPTQVLQKSAIRSHALELERTAKPNAAGLTLLTIEKSIEELETQLREKTWIDTLILPQHESDDGVANGISPASPSTTSAQATITNSIGQSFSLIPASRALRIRGRTTNLRRFWIATHEVTESQWFEVMGKDWQRSSSGFASFGSAGARKDYPITEISYKDALLFCDTLNQRPEERRSRRKYRVPTVSEWVAACLGNASTAYSFGDETDAAFEYAWTDRELHPVGQKKPNDFGLYDCYNNAMELCVDTASTSPIYNGENITIAGRCLFDDDQFDERDHGISFQSLGQFSDSVVKNTGLRLVLEN